MDLATLVGATPRLDRPTLFAVDGVDGAGKTTFAAALAQAFVAAGRPCRVIHEDDFLQPAEIRHRQGRHSPRGFFEDSYDLAGFGRAVDAAVSGGGPGDVVIAEGLFLHRDELVGRWDFSVFLDVPFDVSVGRLAGRDGTPSDPAHPSLRRYVDGQRLYLEQCTPTARAGVVIDHR